MKKIDNWAYLNAITFFKQAATINEQTDYCVDFCLTGNWNEIEVRVYDSKDIRPANQILVASFALDATGFDSTEKMQLIETTLNDILKLQPNELLQSDIR